MPTFPEVCVYEAYADLADIAAVAGAPEATVRRWASVEKWRTRTVEGNTRRRQYRLADARDAMNRRHLADEAARDT
jgi:hypothetical protein